MPFQIKNCIFSEFFIAYTNLVYKFFFWIRPQNFWLTTSTRLLSLFLLSVLFSRFVQFTYQYEVCEVIWHLLLTGFLNFFARNKVQCPYEHPRLPGFNIASLGKQFLSFRTETVPLSSRFSSWRTWRHCDSLKCLERLTKWHSTTAHKNHIFGNTAVRTSNLAQQFYVMLLTQHMICTLAGSDEAIRMCVVGCFIMQKVASSLMNSAEDSPAYATLWQCKCHATRGHPTFAFIISYQT